QKICSASRSQVLGGGCGAQEAGTAKKAGTDQGIRRGSSNTWASPSSWPGTSWPTCWGSRGSRENSCGTAPAAGRGPKASLTPTARNSPGHVPAAGTNGLRWYRTLFSRRGGCGSYTSQPDLAVGTTGGAAMTPPVHMAVYSIN